jgi:hypothetical protein
MSDREESFPQPCSLPFGSFHHLSENMFFIQTSDNSVMDENIITATVMETCLRLITSNMSHYVFLKLPAVP